MRKTRILLPQEEATVNLTPLIDVVFVVLIIFILITPMLELDRVQLASASAKGNREQLADQSITIHVQANNSILFNKKTVTLENLISLLIEAKQKQPNKIPQLYHDRKAYFETYQNIKNAVEHAGFEQLDVILQPG